MAKKKSAGLLLYRENSGGLEVLLVHPGGPFWQKRDDGAWTIPKGEFDDDEDPLKAAKREFEEETGTAPPDGEFIPLEPVNRPRINNFATPLLNRFERNKLAIRWSSAGFFFKFTLGSFQWIFIVVKLSFRNRPCSV